MSVERLSQSLASVIRQTADGGRRTIAESARNVLAGRGSSPGTQSVGRRREQATDALGC